MIHLRPFIELIGGTVRATANNLSAPVIPKCEIVYDTEDDIIYQLSLDTMVSNESLFINSEEIL